MAIARIDTEEYDQPTMVSALRLVRVSRGLSQDELARRADLTRSTISRLENGREEPRNRTRAALERVLGYPAVVLFPHNDEDPAGRQGLATTSAVVGDGLAA